MIPPSRSRTETRRAPRSVFVALVFLVGTGCRACLPSDTDSTPSDARRAPVADAPIEPLCAGAPEGCRMRGPVPALTTWTRAAGEQGTSDDAAACGTHLALQRRADTDPNPSVGVLEREPDTDSPDARFTLVVHTSAGWFEATEPLGLGRTARQGSSYVRWLGADYGTYVSRREGRTGVAFVAVYERGTSVPHGCSLEASAEVRVRLCALVDGVPFCVGDLAVARVPYHADNLLPTVDEALGQCDEASSASVPAASDAEDTLPRDVSLVTHDRLVVREAGTRRVFELGALLCELSAAPELCPAGAVAPPPPAAGRAIGIARERTMAHSF